MNASSVGRVVFFVILCLNVTLVVLLANKLQLERIEVERLRTSLWITREGDYIPSYEAVGVDGRSLEIGAAAEGKAQVLFVYNTTCQQCRASLPAWRSVAIELRSDSLVEVIGISLDSLRLSAGYVKRHQLPFPSIALVGARLRSLHKFGAVPQTIVVDSKGRVLHSRPGLIEDEAAIDSIILAARRVQLTGPGDVVAGNGAGAR